MALDLTEEQKKIGQANFKTAIQELPRQPSRRDALKAVGAVAAVSPVVAAVYLGYESLAGKPVKAALIGCGDEGGVLLGEHDPDSIQFIAACDIRPYNRERILEGELARSPKSLRKGFKNTYGAEYAKNIRDHHFYTDYREMLDKEKEIEAVVIALPLHLHAPVAIECMEKYKKHVLCEKLMARTVEQCKQMIKAAKANNRILSIGHQRHYSVLYAEALGLIQSGILGDIKHIRALWHRNFTWDWKPDPKDPKVQDGLVQPTIRDGWTPPIYEMDYTELKDKVGKYDYKDIYELMRWRLYQRTGGGLMAELGSHQLDAASIFLGKVHPLAVSGVGTHSFYGSDHHGKNPREIDDHVFVTFEFPGKNHPKGANHGTDDHDIVVLTYSSISTNSFEQYGECVMGTRGTLIVEGEKKGMLFKEPQPGVPASGGRETSVSVKESVAGKPVLDSGATPSGAVAASTPVAGYTAAEPSRGYREEMTDFAVCIRRWDEDKHYYNDRDEAGHYKARLPRCHGEVAMADAILALTANLAMAKKQRVEFKADWFKADSTSTPEHDLETKQA